jgi:hypothetical protein
VSAALVIGAVWLGIAVTVERYRNYQAIDPPAAALLDSLEDSARPGDVVLSNVGTRGTFEFRTGIEDPLEGRQALIEAPEFVEHSTRVIEDTHDFFTGPGTGDLPDRLDVNWIVVADQPSLLGGSASWGRPDAAWTVPGFTEVRRQDGFVVLHRPTRVPGHEFIGPAKDRTGPTLVVLLVAAGLAVAGWRLLSRPRRRAPAPGSGDGLSPPGGPPAPAGTPPPASAPASSTGRPGGSGTG